MYDTTDIDAAVRGGALSQADADRLRSFTAARRATPLADEEELPVVGGLADAMTTVALVLMLAGLASVTIHVGDLKWALVAALAWGIAEIILRRRRMPLTGTLLFMLFAVFWALVCLQVAGRLLPTVLMTRSLITIPPPLGLLCATGTMLGCYGWWRRFGLPLAYAGAAMAGLNVAIHVLRLLAPNASADFVAVVLLLGGVATFALAMWWDMSDVYRQTRRAAVAFWLHAMAGFQLAGATFRLIVGVEGQPRGWERLFSFTLGQSGPGAAVVVLSVFVFFCLLALAIDRRSILMSSLIFVVPAGAQLLGGGPLANYVSRSWPIGNSSLAAALIAAGLVLLVISVRWSALRLYVVARLPVALRAQLPRTDLEIVGPRPVR